MANGMLLAVEKGINEPINLKCGGVTIREIAMEIAKITGKEIIWDTDKPMGDHKKLWI